LVTRCRCLGMRWRRAALALNGTAEVRGSWKGPPPYAIRPSMPTGPIRATRWLIPQGSIVTGSYQNTDLGPERRRLDASFDYVTRPDGSVVRLGGAAAVDAAGAGGIPGRVTTHWPTWFFNTVALWMVGAAEQQGSVSAGGAAGSVESAGAQAVGQNGRAAVASSLNFRPTITIKAGTLTNLVMTKMDRAC
jgi:type IV secretory pathway VirB10-like protein